MLVSNGLNFHDICISYSIRDVYILSFFSQETRLEADNIVTPLSDYIVIYSTLNGCVSFRSPKEGSIFISILCEHLYKDAAKCSLLTILMNVRRQMSCWHWKDNSNICTQMSEDKSTLRDDVYFQTNPYAKKQHI